jgi:hypothetical protein
MLFHDRSLVKYQAMISAEPKDKTVVSVLSESGKAEAEPFKAN